MNIRRVDVAVSKIELLRAPRHEEARQGLKGPLAMQELEDSGSSQPWYFSCA
jgi:hypothetical protein